MDRARDDHEFETLLAYCRGRISAAFVRLAEPRKLRLLKGDMPLHAAHVPRLRAVFYASEAWMLRAALDSHRRQMLDLDPFTVSTFDASDLLDFSQQDVFFLSPDAMNPLTTWSILAILALTYHRTEGPMFVTPVGVPLSLRRPATMARARTKRRSPSGTHVLLAHALHHRASPTKIVRARRRHTDVTCQP